MEKIHDKSKIVINNQLSKVSVTSITLNSNNINLTVGNASNLEAAILPSDATNKAVTWKSSDVGVATVDENGKVAAVAAGTTIITCVANDGSDQATTCLVTVIDSKPEVLLGDVNGDGKINEIDYTVLQKCILGEENIVNKENADINKDSKVNLGDLLALRKILLNQ